MNNTDNINSISSDKKKNIINKNIILEKKILLEKKTELQNLEEYINKKKNIYEKNIYKLKKRLQKKIDNTYNFFLEKHFLSLLPIIDSIDSSINLLDNSNNNYSDIYTQLKEINKNFISIFHKYKISVINSINVIFNPDVHQAISIDFSGKYKNNFVSSIIQKGYLLNNRLLRPALVSVSKIYQ
ncbi:nucleotide exchange factor GrpE [Buchnera aphidicola]|nr:nucleotide exchange factor GrpE [Buchnera aphidicola]